MADNNTNKPGSQSGMSNDQRQDQAKANVGGGKPSEQGSQFDRNKEKGAIGGSENRSQAGEPGRARDELEGSRKETTGSSHQR